jgi:hypothetical protein
VNSRTAEAATYSARAQQAQAEVSRLAPYTQFVAMRQQRKAAVESLVNSRFDWAHTFHEFARVLPKDASVTSLTGQVGGTPGSSGSSSSSSSSSHPSGSSSGGSSGGSSASASVTSATPAGSVPAFIVQGCATSQQVVAKTIDRLRLIDGVTAVTLQSSTATTNGTSGSAASGACPSGKPAYQLVVTFQPLPTATSLPGTSAAVSDHANGVQR